MAGDWIKFETTTPDKPEVVRMAAILGIDQDAVVGKLLRLWVWADQNSVDGNGVTVTSAFLDRLTFCPNFAYAMREVGWLVGDDGALALPNFGRHNGKTAKERAVSNRRVAKHRSCNGNETVDVTPEPLQKPLPEKRREEKKEQKQNQERLSSAAPADPPKTADIGAARAERLAQVTDDAIAAFNASALVKSNGGALATVSTKVGRQKRQGHVRRCLRVVRQICDENYGSTIVTPEFWREYFAECDGDDFLRGVGPYSGAHANWRPDFEYLTREATVLKVYDRAASEDAA